MASLGESQSQSKYFSGLLHPCSEFWITLKWIHKRKPGDGREVSVDGGSTGDNGRKWSNEDKAKAGRETAKGFRLRAAERES